MNDRELLDQAATLVDLTNHPGWPVYEEAILQPVINELQDMIFGSQHFFKKGEQLDPATELAYIKAARLLRKVLLKLRQQPTYLIDAARKLRTQLLNMEDGDAAA